MSPNHGETDNGYSKQTTQRESNYHALTTADYNLIIDEVVNPFKLDQTIRKVDFDEDYIGLGMAEEMPDGRILPTARWDEKYNQGSKTFSRELYQKAKSGGLYRLGEKLLVLSIPLELLLKPKSVIVYTYLSEGFLLLRFLEKLKASDPEALTLSVERLPEAVHDAWREDVANSIIVRSIPGLEKQPWNHSSQLKKVKNIQSVRRLGMN